LLITSKLDYDIRVLILWHEGESVAMSTPRMTYDEFGRRAPAAIAALRALSKSVNDAGIEKAMSELIKVRASQMNGCAFCLKVHLDWARAAGVDQTRLDLVAVWREAGVFSERERAALRWAEALTELAQEEEVAAAHADVATLFSPDQTANLAIAIGVINQWNRIAIGLGFSPERIS
jgi:AhpD family alkylhydroperoxidase